MDAMIFELAEAREIFGRDDLRVFDAIAAVARTVCGDDCCESIESDVVCAVTDRVEGELEAGAVAFDGHGRELRFSHV